MKVYFLHGWTYNLNKWTVFLKELKKYPIEPVTLNVPGLTTPSEKEWDIDSYVAWLREKLRGEKNPVLVGHSNGGRISLAYCLKYPTHLKQLVLIDSAGIPHQKILSQVKLKTLKVIARFGKAFSFIPGLKKAFYMLIGATDYFEATPNMRQTMRNMLLADEQIDLARIATPTTIIWGDQDKTTPLSDGRLMSKKIKNSNLLIVKNSGHAPFAAQPQKVAQMLAESLKIKK